jgi:cysteine-rich repeat protein
MPGTVPSATPAIPGGSLCQCDALHVLRFAEDPVLLLPGDVPASAEAARVVVTSVAHTLYGPGRTFFFTAHDAQEVMLGVTVEAATGYVDVDIYLYRPATERVLLSVRMYSSGSSAVWGHVVHAADQTWTDARALASTTRTDWREGDVLVAAAQAPYNQYCLPCRSASQCAACTASAQYFGSEADPVCSAPQPVDALPCDRWAPDNGAGVCVPCPLLEVGALEADAGSAADGCVCAAGYEADPLWTAGSTATLRCRACPAGTFKPLAGDAGCVPCAFGAVAEPGSSVCRECAADEAAPRSSATCQPCEAHSSPLPGNRTHCVCDAGYFRDALSGSCVLCADDFVKAAPGDEGCLPCPPLQSNFPSDQRATCSCDPGAENNGTACKPCPEDSYKDAPGNSACTPCGTGLGTVHPGATSASACVCGRGWYNRSGTCQMCPPNTFNDQAGRFGVESCRACPFRTFQPASGQRKCAPSQVAWPFNTLQHHLVGLRVTASLSCAQLMEVVDGIALSASEVCWGDGNGAATVLAANPALDGQQRAAPAIFGAICGDGVVFPGGLEECDDGNSLALDGCSDCAIDTGFRCDYRDAGRYTATVNVPSSCCRDDGRATCARCFERPSPYPGVVFDGLSCELLDVDECADSSQSTCWQTGAVCVNLDARAGPEAPRYECRCDDVAALCFHLQQFDAAKEYMVQTIVMVEDAENATDVTDQLRNSAILALHRLHHNTSLDVALFTINTLNTTGYETKYPFFAYQTTILVNNSKVTIIAASLVVASWVGMQNVVFENWNVPQ